MGIRSTGLPSTASMSSVVRGRLQDLLLSAVFLLIGPILWGCGAAILSDQPDLLIRFAEVRDVHGIEAAEALVGLLAAAAGVLISLGAGLAVLVALTQEIAGRRGAWQMAHLLAPLSPGFLRRSAALTLGASLALSTAAADSWPRTAETQGASIATEEAVEEPDSALFAPETRAPDRRLREHPHQRAEPEQVVVRLGDSLWDIAADHLGPDATDWEIAASWPRWYELNRHRIGADPGIILPGMILDAPSM